MIVDEPASTPRNNGRSIRKLGALLAGGALIYIIVYSLPSPSPVTCTSLIKDAVETSKENSSTFKPKIIDIVEEKMTGSDPDGLRCSGTALLSNATKETVNYSTYKQYDKWWFKVEPVGIPTN